jgi:uncharacterized membrane protein YkgB
MRPRDTRIRRLPDAVFVLRYTCIMNDLRKIDLRLIRIFQTISPIVSKIAFFIVFFWFGLLKVLGSSPAGPLVTELLDRTMPFWGAAGFMVAFGLFECLIGILFLLPKTERIVFPLLAFHMVTTLMPLVLLPAIAWHAPFVPTLEGQYMIKNVALIALAMAMAADMKPMGKERTA